MSVKDYAKDLNLLEAVTLASIPKSPGNYSPIKNPKNKPFILLSFVLK